MHSLSELSGKIVSCRRCPRLVRWREEVAREKVRRFAHEEYWGKPLPGFGDPKARLLIVGLAPAAHGGNRTGRMFTGDRSGDWLYRALYKAGFATQPESLHARDGLKLHDCYITAAVRCVPPDNKPTLEELRNCRPFLLEEIHLLRRIQVVLGLGRIGFETALSTFKESKLIDFSRKPPFVHGASYQIGNFIFISSYHPSQQNTFTGRLTEEMFDCVFGLARDKLGGRARRLARLGGVQ